jgi:hypothetical protein
MMTTQTNLPLFYRQIEAFDSARHGQLRRPASADFRFAAGATVIPLVISELPLAMRHYPLVFLPGAPNEGPALAILVGVGNERNLFVGDDGAWRADAYIPAYVRRYPFHALRVDTQPDPLLAIDATYAAALQDETAGNTAGDTLVDAAGKASPFLEDTLAFVRDYLVLAERTEAMCRALMDAGVLEEGSISLQAADGAAHQINGFLSINEERLRTLSSEALVALHKADALGLAYAQMLSLANFAHLPLPAAAATATAATPATADQPAKAASSRRKAP